VSQIVCHSDSFVRAYLKALATTDTCYGTGLLGNSTLVLIDTAYKNPATLWSHIAEFDDVLRASLNTLTAGDTVFFYHNGKSCSFVHIQSIKLTGHNTVTATQAAVRTSGLATVQGSSHCTCHCTVIYIELWAVLAATV